MKLTNASSSDRRRYFNDEEKELMRAGLAAQGQVFCDMLDFTLRTGLRFPSELLSVSERNVRGETLHVVGKRGKSRVVPLSETAKRILDDYPEGFKVTEYEFREAWKLVRSAMGLEDDREFVPHVMRHTFATDLVEKGGDLLAIRDLLGHDDVRTTQIYAKVTGSHLKSTIAILD
ncbi:tyrosine-type recombinase/integrase [Vibrio panuliri]|nr:tyrosine-type recombinase/integrase [Vibrio panuliri]